MSKAILIDAAARTVTVVDCDTVNNGCQKAVGGYIETAHMWPNGDVLFVDEDGLTKPQRHFFRFLPRPNPQPLGGNGIIVGREIEDDEGNWLGNHDVHITPDAVAKLVQWMDRFQVDAWAKGNASEPAVTFSTFEDGRLVDHHVVSTGSLFRDMPKPDDDDTTAPQGGCTR